MAEQNNITLSSLIQSNNNLIAEVIQNKNNQIKKYIDDQIFNTKKEILTGGADEKLNEAYDTIVEIADILSNEVGSTTGGLIENVAFLMREVGSETNSTYADNNARAPILTWDFESGHDIGNDIIGVTLPAGKLSCSTIIQGIQEDTNIVSSIEEKIQNESIFSSLSLSSQSNNSCSWNETQITTSGTYYIQFSAEQVNTFNFKYYADEESKTIEVSKPKSEKPLNFTVYKGTYYGTSNSEISDIKLENFTLAYENSMSKKDYNFTCSNEYIYFLQPADETDLIFEKDGFVGGFNPSVVKAFINGYGIEQYYKVYRSTYKQNGTLTIKVK